VLKELEAELKKAGSSMDRVLKVNVYLADLNDYKGMNEVFRGRFGENPPVRTTVATYGGVPGASLVEMDCIAYTKKP
jgi:enamine deaminase RidA (YjgF/YER057c/UK114 family)